MNEHLTLGDYASPGTPALMVQVRAWSIGFSRCSVLLALMNLKGLSFADTDCLSPSGGSAGIHWAVTIKGSTQLAEALKPTPPTGCEEFLVGAELGGQGRGGSPGSGQEPASPCVNPLPSSALEGPRDRALHGLCHHPPGDLRQASHLSETLSSLPCRGPW